MIRAAVIALPLLLRAPGAPCPPIKDDAPLPPHEGHEPGCWAWLRGMDGDLPIVERGPYARRRERADRRCPLPPRKPPAKAPAKKRGKA